MPLQCGELLLACSNLIRPCIGACYNSFHENCAHRNTGSMHVCKRQSPKSLAATSVLTTVALLYGTPRTEKPTGSLPTGRCCGATGLRGHLRGDLLLR